MARLGSIAAAFIGLAGGFAAMTGVLAIPAAAQPLPSSRSDIPFTYAPLVKKVSPTVVNIYTTTTARVQRRLPFPIPGVPPEGSRTQNSLGSGVLVKADGLIVTNAHVVKGADEIRIVLHDRREFDAKLVTQDDRYDLALNLYYPADEAPRGCLLVGTAATESVHDEGIRERLHEGLRRFEAAFEQRFERAIAEGELPPDTSAAMHARLASAVLESLALRARAGAKRSELAATATAAIALLCPA